MFNNKKKEFLGKATRMGGHKKLHKSQINEQGSKVGNQDKVGNSLEKKHPSRSPRSKDELQ